MIEVKVAKIPGPVRPVTFEGSMTVANILELASIGDVTGHLGRFQGEVVQLDALISEGGSLMFTKNIKGNEVEFTA